MVFHLRMVRISLNLKVVVCLLVLSVIQAQVPINAATSSTPKAGATCTKPGQVKVAGSKTFVCAKVGSKSVWISAGESQSNSGASKSQSPAPSPSTPTCTTGVGTKLSAQILQDINGLAFLQITNPTKCNITYSLSGQLGCNFYKNQRATIIGNTTKSLFPSQVVKLMPSMAFPEANTTCQLYQKQSGAGPEYGAGILFFSSLNYTAMIVGISN